MDLKELNEPSCFLSNGKRKLMRLFITYEGERAPMDIPVGYNVEKVKEIICRKFNIQQNNAQLGNESNVKTILIVSYGGAQLLENWILSDLSISPGSTLKAYMKAEMDPIFYFKIMYNEETIPVMEKVKLSDLSTADLRSMASNKCGLPCGVFRMVNPDDKDMYDCHMVEYYDITPGTTIRIETWDGWNEFLKLCTLGFTSSVFENINSEDEVLARFQMKVAMFIAAHFGHVDLAVSLAKHGIRPEDPVGIHPLKQWCLEGQHIDTLKAPVHEAVECGQLNVLRSFVHQNVTCVFAKDGRGLQPLNIALRRRQKACASFLLTKQWSRIPFNEHSIPLLIFSKLKLWSDKAREKVNLINNLDKAKKKVIRNFPLVGQGVFIDGYSSDIISSRSKFPSKIAKKDTLIESYYQNVYGSSPEQYFRSFDFCTGKLNKSRRNRFSASRSLNASNKFASISDGFSIDSDSQAGLNSPEFDYKEKPLKLPKLGLNSSNNMSRSSTPKSMENRGTKEIKSKKKVKKTKSEQNLLLNKSKIETTIPLPLKSCEDTPRPYCYMGPVRENVIEKTLEEYYNKRGYMPRDYAIRCLSLTSHMKEKPWLTQVRIAMLLSKASVKKNIITNRIHQSITQ